MTVYYIIAVIVLLVITLCICAIGCYWCTCVARQTDDQYHLLDQQGPLPGDIVTMHKNLTNECAICLDCFDENDSARILDCGHYFHQPCVDPWVEKGNTCPKCRGENIV